MSRRTAVIEEFDDDTDIPLPSRPLANTGTRGAILEEIGGSSGSDDEDDGPRPSASGPASPSGYSFAKGPAQSGPQIISDRTPFKTYVRSPRFTVHLADDNVMF
jgi:signal recognition particle subunit SRP19